MCVSGDCVCDVYAGDEFVDPGWFGVTDTSQIDDFVAFYSMEYESTVEPIVCYLCTESTVVEKYDTACSHCMSGARGRIKNINPETNVLISGFNDSRSKVTSVGVNADGKSEYYVSSMPKDLALLCANDYVANGVAVLFYEDGLVLDMSESELRELRDYLSVFNVSKRLRVNNSTYEVDNRPVHVAHSAGNYFNTNVNVSNMEERVLCHLLMGLSLRDLQSSIKNNSVTGFHPAMTYDKLSNFEHKWGRTPDVIQMAYPNRMGNVKGYMTKPRVYTRIGERVEMDFMVCEFNEDTVKGKSEDLSNATRTNAKKIPTHGGAIAAWVAYDVYSGFVYGKLVTSVAKAHLCVKDLVEYYAQYGHTIQELVADSGIVTDGKFRVRTPDTVSYCNSQKIRTSGAEGYNHSNGTPHIERVFQLVHKMIRTGVLYILQNPNFPHLGFTRREVLMCWGELFHWSMTVILLKESLNNPGLTRFELFYKRVPNIQEIRLLPIFSVLLVYRPVPNRASIDGANRGFYQRGLYVGPDRLVTGGIRVIVKVGSTLQLIVSTKYKCVTDGGGTNVYPYVERGLQDLVDGNTVHIEPTVVCNDTTTTANELSVESVISPVVSIPLNTTHTQELRGDKSRNDVDNSMNNVVNDSVDECVVEHEVNDNISVSSEVNNVNISNAKHVRNVLRRKRKKEAKVIDRTKWATREERARRRMEEGNCVYDIDGSITDRVPMDCESVTAYYAHWSLHEDVMMYYSPLEGVMYRVDAGIPRDKVPMSESTKLQTSDAIGYRAVTVGVPKTYAAALVDPVWGEAARKEWDTMIETKALLLVDSQVATESIKQGADLVILFPVYEEKEKDNQLVRKVRLVGDGRTHFNAGSTYSPTPSREELKVLLHLAAMHDWDIVHIDEVRAFLNASYKGGKPVYTKLRGDHRYYLILKALYGLKTSPRDYNQEVCDKLLGLGFKPLHISQQLFILRSIEDGGLVIVYDFVDDFVITGSSKIGIRRFIERFRSITTTTEPVYNPTKLLGLELEYDRSRRIIKCYMKSKIMELALKCNVDEKDKVKHVPIPKHGYKINDEEYEDQDGVTDTTGSYLDKNGITLYMEIVGCLIWLCGVRIDIIFATMYLSWFTQKPRIHHMNMAVYCATYLYNDKNTPLVLGGKGDLGVLCDSDASLATAPKRRSVLGMVVRLGENAGAVMAKATTSQLTHSSSFEAELDACSKAFKLMVYISNVIDGLGLEQKKAVLHCDNLAMVNFVKGEGIAKGVRHMEIRMWYTRELYRISKVDVVWKAGTVISADFLTKLAEKESHSVFRKDVQGLKLLV